MDWEGERWCEIQVYQKMGLETSFPKKDATQLAPWVPASSPRQLRSPVQQQTVVKLHIFKLPDFKELFC